MANNKQNNSQQKPVIFVPVFPYEKEAFEKWVQGRYHSVADAIRSHIRNVTGLDPESQEQSLPKLSEDSKGTENERSREP